MPLNRRKKNQLDFVLESVKERLLMCLRVSDVIVLLPPSYYRFSVGRYKKKCISFFLSFLADWVFRFFFEPHLLAWPLCVST